jgi:hypothetical protein
MQERLDSSDAPTARSRVPLVGCRTAGCRLQTALNSAVLCPRFWLATEGRLLALHDESRHTVPAARVVQASSGACSTLASFE